MYLSQHEYEYRAPFYQHRETIQPDLQRYIKVKQ